MVNVSQDIIKSFNEGNKQTALIEVTAGSKTFTITDADIIQGGLKIDRYCVTNSKIEVGSAVASELSLKLRNYDGKFNDVSFEGAVLNVKIGIKLSSVLDGATLGKGILGRMILGSASSDQDVAYVPCGLFIVDTPPRKLSTINISALDYMVLLDREVNASALSFPVHVDALIQKICSICNVTLATDVSVLPNHYFSIGGLPDTNQKLTYRQLLQWCAQLTGTCAFMDGSGRLVLKWYEQTGVTITASERYASDMLENDITITGFTCDDGKGNTYLSGTADYTLDLSDCGFLTNAYEGVLKELQTARGGFAYRPYSATIKSAPYLFPLDMIRYKDKDGVVHDTIVTNVTLALNCNTAISGAGETVTSSSYEQSTSGVTSQQAATDRANLEKINQTATQTNQTKNDLTQFKTQYSSDFEKTQSAIESRVTKETYQTDMAGVSTRIGAAETKISQNADAIVLRATKEELAAAKSDAIDSAAADATSKATAAESNAKSYADAQLKVTNEKIETKVSKGDIASTINQTAQSVQIEASKINLKGAVTTEDISTDGLNAKVIQAGTITATEIKADTITAGNLATGAIMVLLWKNSSPSSTFSPQDIDLMNAMQYSKFLIRFDGKAYDLASSKKAYIGNISMVVENKSDQFIGVFHPYISRVEYPDSYMNYTDAWGLDSTVFIVNQPTSACRPFILSNDTDDSSGNVGFRFYNAVVNSKKSSSDNSTVNNNYMIPLTIFGIK